MAESDKKAQVINKSGTLKMNDKVAASRVQRDINGKAMPRRNNRRDRNRNLDTAPKEFDTVTINIDRVSRTVKGGRRMRFKALVVMGNHKNKVGIGVAKGGDVTSAVQKATTKAKKNMIEFHMDGETICHEVETRSTGADVLMKPAAPGTGIIAGGVVRSIIGLTGIKNLISKSLGSTNKVNIAYAVIDGLKEQVPRDEWVGNTGKKADETTKETAPAQKPAAKKAAATRKSTAKTTKASSSKATKEDK